MSAFHEMANVQAMARRQGPDAGEQASSAMPLIVALLRSTETTALAHAAHAADASALAMGEAAHRQPISDAGAVPALVALLGSGTDEGKTDAACAIASLAQEGLSLGTVTLIVGEGATAPRGSAARWQRGWQDVRSGRDGIARP
jgi:hypothetical protein